MWIALILPALFMMAVLAMQRIEHKLLSPARDAVHEPHAPGRSMANAG